MNAAKAQAATTLSPSEREGASESAWGGAPGAVIRVGSRGNVGKGAMAKRLTQMVACAG